jgi:hypothetical protein
MKIIDIPQTGKLGLTVSYKGRNGLVRRSLAIPKNPRTPDQTIIRSNLAAQARAYRQLTDTQMAAWTSAAASVRSSPSLGQSGSLTGFQLFTKVNCALLAIGEAPVSVPPAIPVLDPVPVDALEITNAAGVITLKLHTTDSPAEGTMLWGCAPVSAGVSRVTSPRLLGTLNSPSSGYVDITTAYSGRFGAPAVGQRVFVRVQPNVNGYQGPRQTFACRVPTAA